MSSGTPLPAGDDDLIDCKPDRLSRRIFIAGAAAAGTGAAASLVFGAEPAGATNGNAVLLGVNNGATAATTITTTAGSGLQASTGDPRYGALQGFATSSGSATGAVYGQTLSPSGAGVFGVNKAGSGAAIGVAGASSSPGGLGVKGTSSGANGLGVCGINTASSGNGAGVYGKTSSSTGSGVSGVSLGSGKCYGVHGTTSSSEGSGVLGVNVSTAGGSGVEGLSATDGSGVRGYAGGTKGMGVEGIAVTGTGVVAFSDSGTALQASTVSGQVAILASNVSTGGSAIVANGDVNITGALMVSGNKHAVVPFPDGTRRAVYCMESPECWFEDFGSGVLSEGSASVALEEGFGATVRTSEYYVFLTPEGNCEGLYVSEKRSAGFEVRELRGGTSSVAFAYRIVARRRDVEGRRLPVVSMPAVIALESPGSV
jgi:hypothetical protein